MKKINIGILLDTVTARCDFCGEKQKPCFRSPVKRSHLVEVCEAKYNWLGGISHVERDYQKLNEDDIDICNDCVNQLSKFTKEK